MHIWSIEKLRSKMVRRGSHSALSSTDHSAKQGELWEVQYVEEHFSQPAQLQESADVSKEKLSFYAPDLPCKLTHFPTAMSRPSYESHKFTLSRTCFRQYSASDMGKASSKFPLNTKLYMWKTHHATPIYFFNPTSQYTT